LEEIMTHFALRLAGAAFVGLTLLSSPVHAVDTGGTDTPTLQEARNDIEAERWQTAVEKLALIVDADNTNADAYNLLGYALRHLDRTDRAMQAYDRALKLNPNHTGALEYQGVLFVMLGDIEKANANLERIEAICGTSCEEYEELAEAIGG
jgi:Flp pilus assembly protein TadD